MPPASTARLALAAAAAAVACAVAYAALGGRVPGSTQTALVPSGVVTRAAASVVDVRCERSEDPNGGAFALNVGTGFPTRLGTVTAAHVIAACSDGGGSVGAGPLVVGIEHDDPAQDLALLAPRVAGTPLALQTALPAIGAPLELLGAPTNASGPLVRTFAGTVLATGVTVSLYSESGTSETLTDAIAVAAPGVDHGDSGGPAIDASGAVVGVIEGAGDGRVYLTPAADLAALAGA